MVQNGQKLLSHVFAYLYGIDNRMKFISIIGFSFVKTTLTFCLQLAPLLGQEETDKLDNKLRSLNVTGDNIASLPFTLIL